MNEDERMKMSVEQARIAHADHRQNISDEYSVLASFSTTAMRAPAVASAGGIAGLLGFYSANSAVLKSSPAAADFNAGLLWFFASILLCVAAPGLAWFSQVFFVHGSSRYALEWEKPFVRPTKASNRRKRWGHAFQATTVLFVLAAIILLGVGAWKFLAVAKFIAQQA